MDIWPPRLLEALSRERRVIIFDNRGMGYSTSSQKKFSIELFAEDMSGLLTSLKISNRMLLSRKH